jgi:hypothetical protein
MEGKRMNSGQDFLSRVRARAARNTGRALMLAVGIGTATFGGCASFTTPDPSLAKMSVVANFDLSKCQMIQQDLYKCPAIDKPVCNPNFVNSDIQCIRVDKNGSVEVMAAH